MCSPPAAKALTANALESSTISKSKFNERMQKKKKFKPFALFNPSNAVISGFVRVRDDGAYISHAEGKYESSNFT